MANELAIHLTTGLTLYAQRLNSANLVWNGSSYETPVNANWANYDIALTESGTTGWYYGTDPDPGTLGGYTVFRQAGGSPAATDISVGGGALGTQPANVTQISDDATAADNLETMLDGTGGQTLSLGRLVVASDGSAGATVAISSTGEGAALEVQNSVNGYALSVLSNNEAGFRVYSAGSTAVQFVAGAGGSGHAFSLQASGGGNAMLAQATSGNGHGLRLLGNGTGTGLSGNVTGNVTGNLSGSVGSVAGDVGGKVLGGGSGTITGTGARVVDASGNNVAPASTALSTAQWTNARAGYLDNVNNAALATTAAQTGDAYAVVTSVTYGNAAIKADTAAILLDTGTDGVVLSAATCNKIADHGRRRTQANVEASSDGDALSLGSLYGFLQQAQESAVASTTLTVYKTDGSTTLGTKTLTVSAGADPVTGIA